VFICGKKETAMEDSGKKPDNPTPSPSLVEELNKMEDEPLLPVEKHLIIGSLVLGVTLLIILAWISMTFFRV
jgi:hypothetical protein